VLQSPASDRLGHAWRSLGLLLAIGLAVAGCAADPAPAFTEVAPQTADESYRLALRYLEADGVPRDDKRAAALLADAAEQGHADAQVLLADAYADGLGVESEPAWATMWYGRAAAQGHAEAQYRLALAHIHGTGTSPDVVMAYRWLAIAASAGHAGAAQARETLAGRMIRQEIEPAERAAKRWRPVENPREPDEPLVRYVQFALQQLGYKPGSTDGILGRQTRRAVAAFAQRERISDERITPDLVDRLRARLLLIQSAGAGR
jgi:TPR repeat protein